VVVEGGGGWCGDGRRVGEEVERGGWERRWRGEGYL
jgi:hypothetical protein